MNNFKKIGLSALAGSLVAVSANAADISMSGGASVAVTSGSDDAKSTYYQNDSITFTVSGETDGGLSITTSLELDGGANASSSFDSRSLKIGHDTLGTITFAGHGGSSVMSGWDDKTPSAYEEAWALTTGNLKIDGVAGDNLWRYDSPELMPGLTVSASYQSKEQTGSTGAYSDIGFMYAPEMLEGLTIGYAVGEVDETANTHGANNVTGTDESTMFVTYASGPITVGYQQSNVDTFGSTADDEQTRWGVLYAVNDEMSISYQNHESDDSTNAVDEDAEGWGASYTTGGMTFKIHRNSADNVGNATNNESEHTEVGVTFAF